MTGIEDKLEALMETIVAGCPLVTHATRDETEIKPSRGKVAVLVEPPTVNWPYPSGETELECKLTFVAGSPWNQPASLSLLIEAIEQLAENTSLPVVAATPVGFQRGDATLAAYQVTLNEI